MKYLWENPVSVSCPHVYLMIVVVMVLLNTAQAKLIAYYECEGDTLNTIARGGNHGINNGIDFSSDVPKRISGHSTQSGRFNGLDAWVDLGNLSLYDTAQKQGASVSFWIKAPAGQSARLIAEGSATNPMAEYAIGAQANRSPTDLTCIFRDDRGAEFVSTGTTMAFDSTWHHVVLTDQGGVTSMYIDGFADMADFSYTPGHFTLDKTSLGAAWIAGIPMDFLNGLMDDVAVWDVVLSPSEINQLTNGIAPPSLGESTSTTGVDLMEVIIYPSTITTEANKPLDLVAELNYKSGFRNAPIVVVMHGYSPTTGNLSNIRANAQRLRDSGFFAISVAMRGRDGSDGVRDSGGLEIYDIYDAVEYVKSYYSQFVDPNNIHITGYNGSFILHLLAKIG